MLFSKPPGQFMIYSACCIIPEYIFQVFYCRHEYTIYLYFIYCNNSCGKQARSFVHLPLSESIFRFRTWPTRVSSRWLHRRCPHRSSHFVCTFEAHTSEKVKGVKEHKHRKLENILFSESPTSSILQVCFFTFFWRCYVFLYGTCNGRSTVRTWH